MSNHNLTEVLQHSLRVAIGATTVLVETLQDTEKRSNTFEELQTQFEQKREEWAQKGEVTEQEGRRVVTEWLNQFQGTSNNSSSSYSPTPSAPSSSTNSYSSNSSVQNLTQQIIDLRKELENLRQSN